MVECSSAVNRFTWLLFPGKLETTNSTRAWKKKKRRKGKTLWLPIDCALGLHNHVSHVHECGCVFYECIYRAHSSTWCLRKVNVDKFRCTSKLRATIPWSIVCDWWHSCRMAWPTALLCFGTNPACLFMLCEWSQNSSGHSTSMRSILWSWESRRDKFENNSSRAHCGADQCGVCSRVLICPHRNSSRTYPCSLRFCSGVSPWQKMLIKGFMKPYCMQPYH